MIHLGLTGWPVSHSLSPKLQTAALHAIGVEGEYSLYPIDPSQPEKLVDLLGMVRNGALTGLNVTIPHKQTVVQLVDELTPPARMIGAVNTVYMNGGRLVGHNTDALGFLVDLRRQTGKVVDAPGNAIVLGAGGSARAVVSVLNGISWRVTVAARNLEQAQVLVGYLNQEVGGGKILSTMLDAESLEPLSEQTGLVINTTPVGMYPKIEFSPWPEGLPLPAGTFIYDLVYNPRRTLLVKQARIKGLRAANGLGMLIEQAALAFEIWTGKAAPRAVMFSTLSPAPQEPGNLLSYKTPEE